MPLTACKKVKKERYTEAKEKMLVMPAYHQMRFSEIGG